MDNKAKLTKQAVERALELHNCGISSSYDMSQVVITDLTDSEDRVSLSSSRVVEMNISNVDDELKDHHKEAFLIAKSGVDFIISLSGCKMESNYDMSHAYIYDEYGNRAKI